MGSEIFDSAVIDEFNHGVQLYRKKSNDYGTSFEECMDAYRTSGLNPLLAALPRLLDKSGRITNLVLGGKAQVTESIVDTLRDLGAYCYMTAAWLAINSPISVTLTDAPIETTSTLDKSRWWR